MRTILPGITYLLVIATFMLVGSCSEDPSLTRSPLPTAPTEENPAESSHDYGKDCVSCHTEQQYRQPVSGVATWLKISGALTHADLLCTSCHDPHGGTPNLRIMREEIPTPVSGPRAVKFLSYDGAESLADGDGTYDGLCEVCHTTTTYHRNNSTGDHTHYAGARCTGCHHHYSFQPKVSDCLQCHDTTQPLGLGDYRRQVVGVGGDFERASHHVNDGVGGESVTAKDCLVCHNNRKHQSLLDPQVRVYNKDSGSTVTFDGTAVSLEPFCVSCHDPDGEALFSDGNSAVDIETGWLLSSHKAGGMTCYGDGVSTGCHANAHGSDKSSLKAPFTGVTPIEEAYCYGCHDADGPATSDVQEDFSGTVIATSPASDALLNTHHDISDADQTYSGAVIECDDCHDPHLATPTQPTLGDIDPSDGRVPAPGNTFGSSNFTTEFCLECHDNSFPAGVTAPAIPLTDLYTEWTDSRGDQHGPDDAAKNLSLRAGSGYAQGDTLNCDVCHDTGHGNSENLFQLRTVIYSKDGSTPLVSDAGGTLVYVTDIASNNTNVLNNSQNWCSTCHPQPMGGNKDKNCFGCHTHGDAF